MRMFLLFILLLMPLNALAQQNCELPAEECKTTAGCYFDGNDCTQCPGSTDNDPQGYYCNGNNNNKQPCPAPFDHSFLGNESINGCYAAVYCSGGTYDYDAMINYGSNPNEWMMGPIIDNQPATTPWPADFSADYHYETSGSGESQNFRCVYKYANCDNWDSPSGAPNGCYFTSQTTNHRAEWQDDDGYWDVSKCECTKSNVTMSDKHCTAHQTYKATNTNNLTQLGTGTMTMSLTEYYCTQCDSGYYVTENNLHTGDPCTKPTNALDVVCSCTITPAGTYLTEVCSWAANGLNGLPNCNLQHCPMGQTCNAGLPPTTNNPCIYGTNTQICDSAGCKNLGNVISGVGANQWRPVN